MTVHLPYMLQSVQLIENASEFRKIADRHQDRLRSVKRAREAAGDDVKAFLNTWFFDDRGREKNIASGRGEYEDIRALLQGAVDRMLIPSSDGREYPDDNDLRMWLKNYGIGIDCSGFVQQALKRLHKAIRVENYWGAIGSHKSEVGFLRCGWIYKEILGRSDNKESVFTIVTTPAQAIPGDILVNRHHMQIVMIKEDCEDGVLFTVAESTSAIDIPLGQTIEESDIGPRLIEIHYPNPDKSISDQIPRKKRLIDKDYCDDIQGKTFVIGRYLDLEKIWIDS